MYNVYCAAGQKGFRLSFCAASVMDSGVKHLQREKKTVIPPWALPPKLRELAWCPTFPGKSFPKGFPQPEATSQGRVTLADRRSVRHWDPTALG